MMTFTQFRPQQKMPDKKPQCKTFLPLLFAMVLLSGCALSAVQENKTQIRMLQTMSKIKAAIPDQRAIHVLLKMKPENPTTSLVLWSDKKKYDIGDEIVFFFRAAQNSYVTIFDVGSSGDLRVIFPNAQTPDNRVQKGEIYRVPSVESRFLMQVSGPSGLEIIKAIATLKPWPRVPLNSTAVFSSTSGETALNAESLLKALDQLQDGPWAEDQIEIEIYENKQKFAPPGRERQIKPKPPEKPIDITGTAGITGTPKGEPKIQLSEKSPE